MSKTRKTAIGIVIAFAALAIFGALVTGQDKNPSDSSSTSPSSSNTLPSTPSTSTSVPSGPTAAFTMPSSCHSIGGLPDPDCTPGATNPDVTQADIQTTICVSGYTSTIRPPSSYTDNLKKQSIQLYGYKDANLSDYEEDHLIALEIGGNPTAVANLWAEPHYGQYTSLNKDSFENYLHSQVCGGRMTLAEAQHEMATNWVQYWLASGGVASSSTTQQTSSSTNGQIAASIAFGSDPITRGNTQTITIKASGSQGPLLSTGVSVRVVYASMQTTHDLSCDTSSAGSCSVYLQIGGTATPGTFAVTVTIDGATFQSSFEVIA